MGGIYIDGAGVAIAEVMVEYIDPITGEEDYAEAELEVSFDAHREERSFYRPGGFTELEVTGVEVYAFGRRYKVTEADLAEGYEYEGDDFAADLAKAHYEDCEDRKLDNMLP